MATPNTPESTNAPDTSAPERQLTPEEQAAALAAAKAAAEERASRAEENESKEEQEAKAAIQEVESEIKNIDAPTPPSQKELEGNNDDNNDATEETGEQQPAEKKVVAEAGSPLKQRLANVTKLFAEKKMVDGFLELFNLASDAMNSFQDSLARSLGGASKAPNFLIDMVGRDKYTFQKMFHNLAALDIKVVNTDGSPMEKINSAEFIALYETTSGVGLERFVDTVQQEVKIRASSKNPAEFKITELLEITQTVAKTIKADPITEVNTDTEAKEDDSTEVKNAKTELAAAKLNAEKAKKTAEAAEAAAKEKPSDDELKEAAKQAKAAQDAADKKVADADAALKKLNEATT